MTNLIPKDLVLYACLVHTAFSQCLLIYSLMRELRAVYSLLFIGFLFECQMASLFFSVILLARKITISGEMDSPSEEDPKKPI